jgi:uncharacterized membrane protein YhhN
MKKVFLYLFLLAGAGEILSMFVDAPVLHSICKPALMITLGLYYGASQRLQQVPLSGVVVLAIIFSCAGDILLMFQQNDPMFFMFGLGAFLLAHVFYIFAYKQHQQGDSSHALIGLQKVRFGFPIVFAGIGLVTILYGNLEALKIPVIIYAATITFMTLTALYRFGRTGASSFAMVFGGAILFMISDSLIAINKFMEPLPLAGFWIMTTYISAQFLIVKGLLKHS